MVLATIWTRVAADLRQKELIPLKLLFFINASTLFVLYPYLTIHMRELGVSVEETAVMNAVTPVIAIIMPPLAGMVADRIGNFRIMLSFFSTIGGIASLLLLMVPVGRFSMPYPSRIPLGLGCGEINLSSVSPLQVTLLKDPPCNLINITTPISLNLESCGLVCQAPSTLDLNLVTSVPVYRVDVNYDGQTEDFWYAPSVVLNKVNNLPVEGDPRFASVEKPQYYNDAIRVIASDHVFFPTSTIYNITCLGDMCYFMDGDLSFRNATRSSTDSFFAKRYFFKRTNLSENEAVASIFTDDPANHRRAKRHPKNETNIDDPLTRSHLALFELLSKNSSSLKCEDPLALRDLVVAMPTIGVNLRSCRPLCLASAPRKQICSDLKREKVYDPSLTFWFYLGVRVLIGIISGTAFAMFEGAVIATLREYKADYGMQRIYATIGGMISSPLTGLLIDYVSRGKEYTDFRPAFYLYAVLKVIGGILMLTIRLDFKAPAPGVVQDVFKVLRNIELFALLLACFLLGTVWGFLESFLFWLLQDLGASRTLMGLTITVGGLAGLPLLALSGPIIERVGHANIICIGFLFYTVRLIGYSLLYQPWICLLFEAMEGVTSSLTFTAVVTYTARLSNSSTDSSIQGLIGGIYYGVGKGAGSLIGGFMIKAVGTRPTYQIFAAACAGFAGVYYLFHNYFTLRRPKRRMNDIMKPSDPEIQLDKVKETEINGAPPVIEDKKQALEQQNEFDNQAYENEDVERKNKENEARID
ncbi:major facilitator superfamily domain-containing protein 6-like [Neocloeon triangulifer]|uniref:major facilitator superfamily domain-containing protein 6-like n=1 Tax=Neocloeon triangulifer TaxID=2078957 RepID=UPI00286F7CF7|nr:major facilitator superfamily domain-containing protein 6-like [Neocloeon triangulifer]XP_059482975.1 major facilitator superfamily domain-containing protein 6-like [Neocloeon triangulifer]